MAVSIKADLEKDRENAKKVITRTIGDMRSRGPGWVSKAVREEYNISASDIKKAVYVAKNGSTEVAGVNVDNVSLTYRGGPLTFSHFGVTPKKAPVKKEKDRIAVPGEGVKSDKPIGKVAMVHPLSPYSISATIKTGAKKVLAGKSGYDGKPFLARANGSPLMPFQRMNKDRNSLAPLKTISIPQMIESGEGTKPRIEQAINENLEKRFNHYCDQYLK